MNEGFAVYAKRLPSDYQINLIETVKAKRTKSANIQQLIDIEGQKLLAAAPKNSLLIALDERGKQWNTKTLANKLLSWHANNQDISFIIGGPDGLAPTIIQKSQVVLSLSKLTLPHQLVKIIVAEQIYRAWSIINNHPYHRD